MAAVIVFQCANCPTTVESKEDLPTGRCWKCYMYRRRHNGEERPPVEGSIMQPNVRECVNCKRVMSIAAHGRCDACNMYFRRRGVERPPEGCLKPSWRPCVNCLRPAKRPRKDRCQSCAVYFVRHGVDIPPERMQKNRKATG